VGFPFPCCTLSWAWRAGLDLAADLACSFPHPPVSVTATAAVLALCSSCCSYKPQRMYAGWERRRKRRWEPVTGKERKDG